MKTEWRKVGNEWRRGPLREAPTAPLAICLAAVAAIESEASNAKA